MGKGRFVLMPQTQVHDSFYRWSLGAELKFAWLPETCYISGKRIWLQYGYRLTRLITGPGDTIFEHRWHNKNAHIIWKLKQ
jgi:hypothetical protein